MGGVTGNIANGVIYLRSFCDSQGFPGGAEVKVSAFSAGDLGQKDPLEKGTGTHSNILA